jgi:hypothetical protein
MGDHHTIIVRGKMKKARQNTNNLRAERPSGLTFKREMIRNLTEPESRRVVGGRPCNSDSGSCPPTTVCTITLDSTL